MDPLREQAGAGHPYAGVQGAERVTAVAPEYTDVIDNEAEANRWAEAILEELNSENSEIVVQAINKWDFLKLNCQGLGYTLHRADEVEEARTLALSKQVRSATETYDSGAAAASAGYADELAARAQVVTLRAGAVGDPAPTADQAAVYGAVQEAAKPPESICETLTRKTKELGRRIFPECAAVTCCVITPLIVGGGLLALPAASAKTAGGIFSAAGGMACCALSTRRVLKCFCGEPKKETPVDPAVVQNSELRIQEQKRLKELEGLADELNMSVDDMFENFKQYKGEVKKFEGQTQELLKLKAEYARLLETFKGLQKQSSQTLGIYRATAREVEAATAGRLRNKDSIDGINTTLQQHLAAIEERLSRIPDEEAGQDAHFEQLLETYQHMHAIFPEIISNSREVIAHKDSQVEIFQREMESATEKLAQAQQSAHDRTELLQGEIHKLESRERELIQALASLQAESGQLDKLIQQQQGFDQQVGEQINLYLQGLNKEIGGDQQSLQALFFLIYDIKKEDALALQSLRQILQKEQIVEVFKVLNAMIQEQGTEAAIAHVHQLAQTNFMGAPAE